MHHRGFSFHAELCAPGIIDLLSQVRARRDLVLEFGCGTGLLTRELVAAGHRVIATDASPAMLDISRELVGDEVEELRRPTLPDDPLPQADAIVAIGHPINYLPDGGAIDRALPNADGSWRRDTEHHENVLVGTPRIPELLRWHGIDARTGRSFGTETLPEGLHVVIGCRERARCPISGPVGRPRGLVIAGSKNQDGYSGGARPRKKGTDELHRERRRGQGARWPQPVQDTPGVVPRSL